MENWKNRDSLLWAFRIPSPKRQSCSLFPYWFLFLWVLLLPSLPFKVVFNKEQAWSQWNSLCSYCYWGTLILGLSPFPGAAIWEIGLPPGTPNALPNKWELIAIILLLILWAWKPTAVCKMYDLNSHSTIGSLLWYVQELGTSLIKVEMFMKSNFFSFSWNIV